MAILIAGVTALLISIAMAGWFSKPIMDITEAVREMSRGNYKKRIPYHSNDELGFLTEAFNDMGDHLEKSMHLVSTPIAIDGVSIVVNPDNQVSALTSEQIKNIFLGNIKNWKEVGGVDVAITLRKA